MATANSNATLARLQETRVPEATAVFLGGPAIAVIFVAMRIYTRVFLTKKYFLEDYSIVASLASSIAMSVFMSITLLHGSGRHIETVSAADLLEQRKVSIGTTQFYSCAHYFLKLSILLQYIRVAILPWERRLCHLAIAILSAGYLALFIVRMVRCIPFEAQWIPNYPGARCVDTAQLYFASQGWNMVMDLLILLGPPVILRHSSAPFRQKLLFGIALAFGAVACIVSALRLRTILPSTKTADPSWDQIPSGIYGVIEVNLGIVCACVVMLRPLFRHLRRSSRRDNSSEQPTKTLPWKSRRHISPQHLTLSTLTNTQISSVSRDVEIGQMGEAHVISGSTRTEGGAGSAERLGSEVASPRGEGNVTTSDSN